MTSMLQMRAQTRTWMDTLRLLSLLRNLSIATSLITKRDLQAGSLYREITFQKPLCEIFFMASSHQFHFKVSGIELEATMRITIWGHLLRSLPFLMSGHLNFNFFQALGTPLFYTNLNNGCPNMIYQHSGQAHKHFSHRFHGRSFLADVQT